MERERFNLISSNEYFGDYVKDVKRLKYLVWTFRLLPIVIFPIIWILLVALLMYLQNPSNKISTKKSPPRADLHFKTSFDCSKANTYVEKTICSDKDLAKLDIKLSNTYKTKLAKTKNKQNLQSQQKDWVLNTENSCTDKQCISDVINARINILSKK